MAKFTELTPKDNEFSNMPLDKSQFNDVEKRYLKLLKKKQKYDIPLTKSEQDILKNAY